MKMTVAHQQPEHPQPVGTTSPTFRGSPAPATSTWWTGDTFRQQHVILATFVLCRAAAAATRPDGISRSARARNTATTASGTSTTARSTRSATCAADSTQSLTTEGQTSSTATAARPESIGDVLVGQVGVLERGSSLFSGEWNVGSKYLLGFDRPSSMLSFGARATHATSGSAEIRRPLPARLELINQPSSARRLRQHRRR